MAWRLQALAFGVWIFTQHCVTAGVEAVPIRIATDRDTGEMYPVLPDGFVPPAEGEDYDYESLLPEKEQWEKYSAHMLQQHALRAADPETRAQWDVELETVLRTSSSGRRLQSSGPGSWVPAPGAGFRPRSHTAGAWGILDRPEILSSTVQASATMHNSPERTEFGAELGSSPVASAGTTTSFRCDDVRATNPTGPGPCIYDCNSLKEAFFADEMTPNRMLPSARLGNAAAVKCYLYNNDGCSPSETESCFKLDGAGQDLFELKKDQLDYYTHMSSDSGSFGPWTFRVGDDICTTVQIITSMLIDETAAAGPTNTSEVPHGPECHQEEDDSVWCNTTVERCLPDGIHHHAHDPQNATHRVNLVGGEYNPQGAADGTLFTVGECEDIVIRVTTLTAPTSGLDEFSLVGADTSAGPTTFQTTRSDQVPEELSFCMYDNPAYTLTAPVGWTGSIKVVSVAPDNTIEIPRTESWIVQGAIGTDGLPVKLDARFKSGSFFDISHANLVFRHFRVSAQVAPLDVDSGHRTYSTRILPGDPTARIGGALHYEGGHGCKLIFEYMVYDHNYATSGGALMVDGRYDLETAMAPAERGGLDWQLNNVLFLANNALWCGGAIRWVSIWPLRFDLVNVQFLDGDALIGHAIIGSLYCNAISDAFYNPDPAVADSSRWTSTNVLISGTNRPRNFGLIIYGPTAYGCHSAATGTTFDYVFDRVAYIDYVTWYTGIFVMNAGARNSTGTWRTSIKDCVYHNTTGDSASNTFIAPLFFWSDYLDFSHTTVSNSGTALETSPTEGTIFVDVRSMAAFSFSTFEGNRAGVGGAVAIRGEGAASFQSCIFRDNKANSLGGAIVYKALRSLMVEQCIFDGNKIDRSDNPETEVVVRVYSGDYDLHNEHSIPNWFIGPADDELLRRMPDAVGGGQFGPGDGYGGVETNLDETADQDPGNCADPGGSGCDPRRVPGWGVYDPRTGSVNPHQGDRDIVVYPEGCSSTNARMPSETAESDLFTPPWPLTGAADGDDYGGCYEPRGLYSHVVKLPQGRHRLWHGVLVKSQGGHKGWAGEGWIDIPGVVDRIYPQVFDNRIGPASTDDIDPLAQGFARQPGCYEGAANVDLQLTPPTCHQGWQFWSYTDFENNYGSGGGIALISGGSVVIRDSVFTNNNAGTGTQLYSVASDGLELTNTTFEATSDSLYWTPGGEDGESEEIGDRVVLDAVDPETCDTILCDGGLRCRMQDFVRMCEPCMLNEIGNGRECSTCEGGTTPDATQSACVACPDNFVSTVGVCLPCLPGETHGAGKTACVQCPEGKQRSTGSTTCTNCVAGKNPSADRTVCLDCERGKFSDDGGFCRTCSALGQVPNTEQTGCEICPPGFQPSEAQDECVTCALFPNTFSDDGRQCRDCPARQQASLDRTECFCMANTFNRFEFGSVFCDDRSPPGDLSLNDECGACPDCLDCSVAGSIKLKPGFSWYGQNRAYSCRGNDRVALESCVGGALSNLTVSTVAWQETESGGYLQESLESMCGEAYGGPACANCKPDFHHLKVGKPCTSCLEGKVDIPMLLGMSFGGVVAASVLISGAYKILVDHGVITDLRLLVGFYQLLGQMDNVLSLEFPRPVPKLIQAISFLFLDLRKLIKLDCWDVGGFYGKLTTNCFVLPALGFGCCALMYYNQRRTIGAVIAAGGADESAFRMATVGFQQNVFFVIFLIYPLVTTTLFRVPQCFELGPDSFHEDDFTVDCNSGPFYTAVAFALITIVAVPIGVPLCFLWLMSRAKSALPNGKPNTTLLGGAKLCSDDMDDDQDRYGFLCRDLKPEYWYYEIVTYTRKLCLGGLSIFVGRGTMAQAYFVAAVEAGFLMHHMRAYPYVRDQHNQVDALGHAALMLTYTITLILRNDSDDAFVGEIFPRAGYGWFIVFLYVVVLPLPTFINFWRSTQVETTEAGENREFGSSEPTEAKFNNPLSGNEVDGGLDTDMGGESTGAADSSTAVSGSAIARLARLDRERKDAQAEAEALRQEVDRLKQQQGQVVSAPAPVALGAKADGSDAAGRKPAVSSLAAEPSQAAVLAMKQVVADETLSEEVRATAQKNVESLVQAQMQSAQLMGKTLAAEQIAIARDRDRGAMLASVVKEDHFNIQYLDAMKKNQHEEMVEAREGLARWLSKNRLLHHERKILEIVGQHASVEDFGFMSDDDIGAITGCMTAVEGSRFKAAIAKQSSAQEEEEEE